MWNKLVPPFLRGRIILCLLLAFMAGIVLEYFLAVPPGVILCLSGGFLLAALAGTIWSGKNKWLFWAPLCLCLGLFLCWGQMASLSAWDFANGHNVEVTGKVIQAEDRGENWRARLRVEQVDGNPLKCADIYIYGEGSMPAGGSRIQAIGQVFEPDPYGNMNAFDYNDYLHQQGIAGAVSTLFTGEVTLLQEGPAFWPGDITQWLRSGLDKAAACLSDEQKALVYGVFLGDKSGLDYEMKNALGLSGALHAFAVSGLHVGYIVMLAMLLTGSAYRRRLLRFWVCVGLLAIYISLTGFVASVLRASVMALCLLLSSVLDELDDRPTALAIAAVACLLAHPLWLFSAGFQLSFAAAGSIIAFMPMFRRLLAVLPAGIRDFFSVTFAATLGTLPLISYYFYHISWLGWLLSPVVIVAAGIAVILSFCATVIAVFSPWLAGLFLQAASYGLTPVYHLCVWAGNFSRVAGAVPLWSVLLFYLAAAFLPLLKKKGRIVNWLAVLMLLVLFALVPPEKQESSLDGDICEIVFLDVGQGDSALIITPDNYTAMIDGGGDLWNPGDVGEYSVLPYLKSRGIDHIDLLVNSHPDEDHADGLLSVLTYLQVDALAMADIWPENSVADRLKSLAEADEAQLIDLRAGDILPLGDQVVLECYYPTAGISAVPESAQGNDYSLICKISYGDIGLLFTGDMGGSKLAYICEDNDITAQIIKIPHHGSKTGYCSDLADILDSEAAVISVGADNSYGHPGSNVVEYWQEHGAVYRTDQDGAVSVFCNGTEYEIVTYY